MNIGMLWSCSFSKSKTPLANEIEDACRYYQQKYGLSPTVVVVNPKDLPENFEPPKGIKIEAARHILPRHLWIGRE
jgi:hypothetical protein